jgi:drug/metabolite transporter (DMT)-like permease
MKKRKFIGNLLLLITAIIWGMSFVFQRSGMDYIEPITFNASRNVLAAILISALSAYMGKRDTKLHPDRSSDELTRRKRATIVGGISCGIMLSLACIFQQMGMVYTTAGKGGFITSLYMVIVPIFNFLLFRKKNPLIVWVAVLIGVVRLYLLCATDGLNLSRGDTLVVICAFLYAGHILCADRFVVDGDPIAISAIQFIVAAVICIIGAFIFEDPTWEKIVSAAVPILFCGLLSSSLGYTFQIVAQKMTDPTSASLLLSLESVFAVISGAILLGERMSGREILGCVVMFTAIILVQLPSFKQDSND